MFKGSFAASLFFKLATYVIIPTLVIIYWISQAYGHQPAFPNCWISKVAQHYPQYVYFRVATISGSVLVALGWFTNYFYLKTICKEHTVKLQKYLSQVVLVLGLMGTMLLMGNTATIDSGKMNEHWHQTCAHNFFIFTLVSQVLNTVIYTLLHSKIKQISYNNIIFKYVLIALLLIQIAVSYFFGYSTDGVGAHGFQSVNIFLEWSLTVTVILGFYSMALDVDDFNFVYESNTIMQKREMEQID